MRCNRAEGVLPQLTAPQGLCQRAVVSVLPARSQRATRLVKDPSAVGDVSKSRLTVEDVSKSRLTVEDVSKSRLTVEDVSESRLTVEDVSESRFKVCFDSTSFISRQRA